MNESLISQVIFTLLGFASVLFVVSRNNSKAQAIVNADYVEQKKKIQALDDSLHNYKIESARKEGTYVEQIKILTESLAIEKGKREAGNVENAKKIAVLEERLKEVQVAAKLMEQQMEILKQERQEILRELEDKKTELAAAMEEMKRAQDRADALFAQVSELTNQLNETQSKLASLEEQYGNK